MSKALRDFFVQEAGDYLDRLAAALVVNGTPDFDRMRRLARALRGSARMADQEAIAEVAGAVQSLAGDLSAGDRRWDSEIGDTLKETLVQFRQLLEEIETQPTDLGDRAALLVRRLGGATQRSPLGPAATPDALEGSDLQEYLGEELRRVVSEIREAVGILEREPRDREPLKKLLRRIRPLRGVQGLNELGAAGAALSALEEVILRIADTSATVGPGHLALFNRAELALSDAADQIATGDRPSAGSKRTEIEDLKEQVLEVAQREVIWISELFHDDEGAHLEACPMADRGAGSWEAFFLLEATGSLDTADRLRAEMMRDPDGTRTVAHRLAYTFRQLRERALTFGHSDLARVAGSLATLVRGGVDDPPQRLQAIAERLSEPIEGLRGYLASPDDEEARASALAGVERAMEARAGADGKVVPIDLLTYTSDDALARALGLRDELMRRIAVRDDASALRPLVEEVFGLIEHALERSDRT